MTCPRGRIRSRALLLQVSYEYTAHLDRKKPTFPRTSQAQNPPSAPPAGAGQKFVVAGMAQGYDTTGQKTNAICGWAFKGCLLY